MKLEIQVWVYWVHSAYFGEHYYVIFSQEDTMDFLEEPQPKQSFNFSSHKKTVDWKQFNAVDVERLIRDIDIDALMEHFGDITFGFLDGVICHHCVTPLNPFIKAFRLAQLSLEWLNHCQKKSNADLHRMEEKLKKKEGKYKNLEEKNKEQKDKIKELTSDLGSTRNAMKTQQSLFSKDVTCSVMVMFKY